MECVVDPDCRTDQICHENRCIDPCLVNNPCAVNAICEPKNHRSTCRCPDGMLGDPFQHCERVECHINQDCSTDMACRSNRCINPCLTDNPCAPTATCRTTQHNAACICPPGTLGDPLVACSPKGDPIGNIVPECTFDSECPSGLACLDEKCKNPCYELDPCDRSAICEVVDTVPFRTMICSCKLIITLNGHGKIF